MLNSFGDSFGEMYGENVVSGAALGRVVGVVKVFCALLIGEAGKYGAAS